jgi:NTE family protein
MLVQGLVHGGTAGARLEMRRLWRRIAEAHALSLLRNGPIERWLWGWDLSNSLIWRALEATMRLVSPAMLNPFGHNPLRRVIEELLDREALIHPSAPRLTIAATDVTTGEAVLFGNEDVTVDVLLASSCLPFVFPAVEIAGRAYWDGGYAGNPPLRPLLLPDLPEELVLVRAQPAYRPGIPQTPTEILNRLNEIACQTRLGADLESLPASVGLSVYEADDTLRDLPISSKFNGEPDFLSELFAAGRACIGRRNAGRLDMAVAPVAGNA